MSTQEIPSRADFRERAKTNDGNRAARLQRSGCSERQILPAPNRVSEELLWAWGEFVSRWASETSFAVLLKPRYDDLPTSATLPFTRHPPSIVGQRPWNYSA